MMQKKDTTVLTLALLCAIAAAEQPAAASSKFASVLAQTPTSTAPPTSTAVPNATQLRISSSSSMERVNAALKQSFEQQFPSKQVTIEYGDAIAALRAVRQEKADLAAIGRPLTRREKARGLVAVPVSRNKIAIVVGANNPFTGSLTDRQFAKIFRGEITDWSELGGAPGRIRVIDRPPSSDTRQALSEYPVFQGVRFDTSANAVRLSEDSTEATIRELGTDGIGIAIADQVVNQPGVRSLPLHKTTPDDPKYPFSQPLYYVYKKTNTSPALQAFLGYAATPTAQNAIAQAKATTTTATPGTVPSPGAISPGVTNTSAQLATPGATPLGGATPSPALTTPGATPTDTATIPGTTPSPALTTPGVTPTDTVTIPGTTPSPTLATPGVTPTDTVTIPASTPSPQATAATPAGDAAATASNGGLLGTWWLWLSGLLLFLLWGWLKNKRSEPKSNHHLSLSHLDALEPTKSPTVDRVSPPRQKIDLSSAANERSEAVKSDPAPTASNLTEQSTPTAPTIPASAIATGAAVAASGLAAESAISDSSGVSSSQPPAEDEPIAETPPAIADSTADTTTAVPGVTQETSSTSEVTTETSDPTPAIAEETEPSTSGLVTEPAISDSSDVSPSQPPAEAEPIEETTTAISDATTVTGDTQETFADTTPAVTEETELATSNPVTEPAISDSSDVSQPTAPQATDVVEETTQAIPSVTQWTAIATSGFAATDDSQPTEATSAPVSEITSDTGAETEAIASSAADQIPASSLVQPVAEDVSFATFLESSEPSTPAVSNITEETIATTPAFAAPAAIATSGLVAGAGIAAVDDSQPTETIPAPVSEITSETTVIETEAIASNAEETPITSAAQPVAEDSFVPSSEPSEPSTNITEETIATTPIVTEEAAIATSGLMAGDAITAADDWQPAEATSAPVSEITSDAIATSGLVAGDAITATDDSQPTEATPTQVSEMTSDTTVTETEAIASSSAEEIAPPSDLQSVGNDSQPIEETPAQASEITAETTTGATEATAIATGAALAAGAAILSAQTGKESDREEVETAKFDPVQTENADLSTASSQSPEAGEENSIVLLSREAEWAYTQWTISERQKEKLCQAGCNQLILRLYDVTDIDLNNQQPQSIEQTICQEDSQDAYLVIPARDRDYMVEIGYAADGNPWVTLARSSAVRIPPPSEEDVQLADVEFEAVRLLSAPPVSPELLSSSAGKLGTTNLLGTDTSANTSPSPVENTNSRKFRLMADAELSFYGETEPDAKVTIDGRPIELDPNGIFRCQMLFPDGTKESTITAVTADGETYSIQMKFTRSTVDS